MTAWWRCLIEPCPAILATKHLCVIPQKPYNQHQTGATAFEFSLVLP